MELTKVNNIMDTLAKATPEARQKTSGSFDNLVARAAGRLDNQQKVQNQDDTYSNEKVSQNLGESVSADSTKAADSKTDSKDIKELKNAVDQIIKDDTNGDLSKEALNLLNLISMLLGSMQDPAKGSKTDKESIITGLKQKLNLTDVKAAKLFDMLNKLAADTNQPDNLLKGTVKSQTSDIKKELFALLNNSNKDNRKNTDSSSKDNITTLKEVLPEIKQVLASKGNTSEQKEAALDKKGDNLLKALASGDKSENSDPKISGFMNKLNAMTNDKVSAAKEPEVINQKNLTGDIIKTLKYMETSSIKNLTVKINPKELGEVVVNITMEAGVMKATITAANKDAYNLIQGNLQDINSRLNSSDVKIANLSLNVYNDDTTYYSNESGRDRNQQGNGMNRNNNSISAIAADEDVQEESYLEGNVNKLA